MGSLRILQDFRLLKDNGDVCTDGQVAAYLAGATTPTTMYSDKDLTSSLGSTEAFSSLGYPPDIWVSDQESVKIEITGTGVTTKTQDYRTVASSSATDSGDSASEFKNFLRNGGFATWSGGTSFSNISGSGTGAEVADGWTFVQSTAASNAITRQTGTNTGARYALRMGRPAASTSTNALRLWQTLNVDEAYRAAGRTVIVSFTATAGANYSPSSSGLGIKLATGTTESQSGDLITSDGWGGHVNAVNQTQIISTTKTRYQFSGSIGAGVKNVGVQFSMTGVGTAGANDWVQIEDVQLEISTGAATDFHTAPEPLDFLRENLSAFGRTLVDDADAAAARSTLGVVIGTNVQAYDADLTTWAGVTPSASAVTGLPLATAAGIALWDDADAAAQRTTLGLGTAATVADSTLAHLAGTETFSGLKTFSTTPRGTNIEGFTTYLDDGYYAFRNTAGTRVGYIQLSSSGNMIIAAEGTNYGMNFIPNGTGTLKRAGNLVYDAANLPGTAITWTARQIKASDTGRNAPTLGSAHGSLQVSNTDPAYGIIMGVSSATGAGWIQAQRVDATGTAYDLNLNPSGGNVTSAPLQARVQSSTETTGTLTSASANKTINATGGITINDGVFTAGDMIVIYAGSSSRTITQDTGMTLRLDGTATTGNRTIAAFGKMHIYFNTNAEAICSGQGVS